MTGDNKKGHHPHAGGDLFGRHIMTSTVDTPVSAK